MSQIPGQEWEPQAEPPAEQPGWPKGIGIFSIVWGSLGVICGLFGAASTFLAPQFMKAAETQMGPVPDVMKPPPVQGLLALGGVLITIALIVGGIMVIKRNPVGRLLHLVYAGLSLVLTGVAIVVQLGQLKALKEWAAANPDSKWASQIKPELQLPIMAFTTLLSVAYPLFCIVWFGMIKNKPGSMGVAVKKDYI